MSYPAIPLDGAGPRLLFGDCVLVRAGTHAGRVAEVVGWGGRRGVELIVHGPVPAFVALPPALVEPVDTPLLDPVLPCRRGRTEPAALPAAAGPCCGETRGGSLGPGSPGGRLVAGRYDQQARARSRSGADGGGDRPGRSRRRSRATAGDWAGLMATRPSSRRRPAAAEAPAPEAGRAAGPGSRARSRRPARRRPGPGPPAGCGAAGRSSPSQRRRDRSPIAPRPHRDARSASR